MVNMLIFMNNYQNYATFVMIYYKGLPNNGLELSFILQSEKGPGALKYIGWVKEAGEVVSHLILLNVNIRRRLI